VNSTKRTHLTLATLESPRELLPFYSSVAIVPLVVFVPLVASVPLVAFVPQVAFVPLTFYQSLRKLWNITIPLGGW